MTKKKFLQACKILKNGEHLAKIVQRHKFTELELDVLFRLAPAKKLSKKREKQYAIRKI